MGTTIRPEVSAKNKYWIGKHRYYELKHFCLQYPVWIKARASLDGLSKNPVGLDAVARVKGVSDPTAKCAEAREYFVDRIRMVEKAAKDTDAELSAYLLKGVTESRSYDTLKALDGLPCCKDTYYRLYRKFFWLLSKARN